MNLCLFDGNKFKIFHCQPWWSNEWICRWMVNGWICLFTLRTKCEFNENRKMVKHIIKEKQQTALRSQVLWKKNLVLMFGQNTRIFNEIFAFNVCLYLNVVENVLISTKRRTKEGKANSNLVNVDHLNVFTISAIGMSTILRSVYNGHCMFMLINSIWILLNRKREPFRFEYFSHYVENVRSWWFSFVFSSPSTLQKFKYNFKSKNRNFERTKMFHSMVNIGSVFINLLNV